MVALVVSATWLSGILLQWQGRQRLWWTGYTFFVFIARSRIAAPCGEPIFDLSGELPTVFCNIRIIILCLGMRIVFFFFILTDASCLLPFWVISTEADISSCCPVLLIFISLKISDAQCIYFNDLFFTCLHICRCMYVCSSLRGQNRVSGPLGLSHPVSAESKTQVLCKSSSFVF